MCCKPTCCKMRVPAALLACVIAICATTALADDNGLGAVPALGWNTWCTEGECERDYCNEQELMAMADAMHTSGLYDMGFRYLNMDDCWGGPRNPTTGAYEPDSSRFPHGMKYLADYIHSKGLKMGVYTDSGQWTCSQGGRPFKIPGSYGHYAQDAETFASWGVDYVKQDWCNTKLANGTQLDPRVVYPTMSKALNATGRKIWFNSCEWGVDSPWLWAPKVVNSYRIGGDHHDNWPSTAGVIENAAGKSKYAGPGGWGDLDFIMTGGQGCPSDAVGSHCPGQTNTEYVSEFTIWALVGSPLLVATDIRNMTAIMKEVLLNKEIIAMNQDPLGRPGDRVGFWDCSEGESACQIWSRTVTGGQVIVLYNAGTESHHITADFSTLGNGWGATTKVNLRDMWKHESAGTATGSYTAEVPSHGVVAVLATRA